MTNWAEKEAVRLFMEECHYDYSQRQMIEATTTALLKARSEGEAIGERRGRIVGWREAADEVESLAPVLDHPSVFMGGPSRTAKRNAKFIADAIRDRAKTIEAGE